MKIKTEDQFKKYVLANPLLEKLKARYPDRDYEYQLDLMIDWWKINKNKLPVSIAAFDNWLKYSKVDENVVAAKKAEWRRQEMLAGRRDETNTEVNEEGLRKLRELTSKMK